MILPLKMHAILSFVPIISESCSNSKHVLPSSLQDKLNCRLSNTSKSHEISESNSYPTQTKATNTQIKLSPQAIDHRTSLQSASAKKQTDTPRKSRRLSKKHKSEESPTDLGSSEVSVEEIRKLFKPLLPCISPLPDTVRIWVYLIGMLFFKILTDAVNELTI